MNSVWLFCSDHDCLLLFYSIEPTTTPQSCIDNRLMKCSHPDVCTTTLRFMCPVTCGLCSKYIVFYIFIYLKMKPEPFNHYMYNKIEGPSWSWSYGSWIYNYLCNQCLSPLTLWVWIPLRWGVLLQYYVIKFVNDLWQVSGFLRVLRFSPTIKLTATIQLKYCWNHHNHNPDNKNNKK